MMPEDELIKLHASAEDEAEGEEADGEGPRVCHPTGKKQTGHSSAALSSGRFGTPTWFRQ